MTRTAFAGPLNVFGQAAVPPGSQLGVAQDSNPNRSPSLIDMGLGIADPRYPYGYQAGGDGAYQYGWGPGCTRIPVINVVPPALAVAAVAAAANVVAATPMTLVSTSGAGIVVGASVVNAATGATVTGLLAIAQAAGTLASGSTNGNLLWDPAKALSRAVAITAAGSASGTVTFTVRGFDIYGYPMTETIASTASSQTKGKKAFKYIQSVTPSASDAINYSVDTTDIIGFPLRVDAWPFAEIYYGGTATTPLLVSAAVTGFVAAVTTSPATATTGDVRGTYALQSASDATKALIIFITPSPANLSSSTGLVGVTQV